MKYIFATIFLALIAFNASASLRSAHKSSTNAYLDLTSVTKAQTYMIYADCGSTKTELFLLDGAYKEYKKCSYTTLNVAGFAEKGRLSNLYKGIYEDQALLKKGTGELSNSILVDNTYIQQYGDAVGKAYEALMAQKQDGSTTETCGKLLVKATQKPIMVMQATAGARKELGTLLDAIKTAKNGISAQTNLKKIREIVESSVTAKIQSKLDAIYTKANNPISKVSLDIIAGRFEGLFAFTALKASIGTAIDKAIYYEIGGASAQIAFTCGNNFPARFMQGKSKTSGYIKMNLGGTVQNVFSHSFLGTGQNELFRQIFQFNGLNGKSACYSEFDAAVTTAVGYEMNPKTEVKATAADQFDACAAEIKNIFDNKGDDISQGKDDFRKWSDQFAFISGALAKCGAKDTLYVNNRMNLDANDGQLTLAQMKAGASSATPYKKSCGKQSATEFTAVVATDADLKGNEAAPGRPSNPWKLAINKNIYETGFEFMARTCFLYANVWEVAAAMGLPATTKVKEASSLAAWVAGGAEIYSTLKLKDGSGGNISDLSVVAQKLSGPSASGGLVEWNPFDPNTDEKVNLDLTANQARRMKRSRKHRNKKQN